jgi:hypothetical protein
MKSRLSITMIWFVLTSSALGFAALCRLSPFPSREIAPVNVADATTALPKRVYCDNGTRRQYSNVHRAWVCFTELTPSSTN